MFRKILPFTDIDKVQAFLLDAAGVFYAGDKEGLYAGTLETFSALRKKGIKIGIITNTTALSIKMEEKFTKFGLRKQEHYDFLFTAGQVFRDALTADQLPFKTEKKKYWMFGEPHPVHGRSREVLFAGTPYSTTDDLEEADFIFIEVPHIGGKDIEETAPFKSNVEKLIETMEKLGMQPPYLPMVCPNPDRFVQEGHPPQTFVRQGLIAELYEQEGGKAFRYGKPGEFIFREAFRKFGGYGIKGKEQVLMVGDSPNTDIRGAQEENFPTILVTDTGIAFDERKRKGEQVPKYLSELPATDRPNYYISRFSDLKLLLERKPICSCE